MGTNYYVKAEAKPACDCFLALRPGEMTPHERWEVQRQAESLAANDSRGERQAVLK